jgi:hypothetical protein
MLKSSSLCLYSSNLGTFWLKIKQFWPFEEISAVTDFDRLCKLEKRGDEIKKKSSPLKLRRQSEPIFAEMILRWSPFKIVRQRRPVSKMAAITKNRNFFKWPKLLYFKPESAQI